MNTVFPQPVLSTLATVLLAFCGIESSAVQPAARDVTIVKEVPVRITTPGTYQLSTDLQFDDSHGAAITIETDRVTLDLNGQTLSGTADATTLAIGVHAVGRSNITITNGRLRGFYFGIDLRATADGSSKSHTVSNVILADNLYFGMRVVGADCEIRHCMITNTGGSTRARHTIPHGVRLLGPRNIMRDCCIIDLHLRQFAKGKGEIVGVHFDAAPDAVFNRNTVIELTNDSDSRSYSDDTKERAFGVWFNGGPDKNTFVEVRDNTFLGFTVPLAFAPGSDGRVVNNTFYDADEKPVRGKPAAQSSDNKSFTTH